MLKTAFILPRLARTDEFSGIDSGGHAYMENFSTPFFDSMFDMGLVGADGK